MNDKEMDPKQDPQYRDTFEQTVSRIKEAASQATRTLEHLTTTLEIKEMHPSDVEDGQTIGVDLFLEVSQNFSGRPMQKIGLVNVGKILCTLQTDGSLQINNSVISNEGISQRLHEIAERHPSEDQSLEAQGQDSPAQISIVQMARDIAIKARARKNRHWFLGEVLEYDGGLYVRDILDEQLHAHSTLESQDIGLTVLTTDNGYVLAHIYLDSDDIRSFLPYVQQHENLRQAILEYDRDTASGPPSGRNFLIEDADIIIARNWGRTREGARASVERAVRRSCVYHHLNSLTSLLTPLHLELHAYGKEGKPSPPQNPAVSLLIEPAYEQMPAGREKIRSTLTSRVATVDDILFVYRDLDFVGLDKKLQEMYQEISPLQLEGSPNFNSSAERK
jgi:hypothetical protein